MTQLKLEPLFFDSASTTPCCPEAADQIIRFAREIYGNPSSSHLMGQLAAGAIREARLFFAQVFNTAPEQVIFTGSGSEADNLAVYGVTLQYLCNHLGNHLGKNLHEGSPPSIPRVLVSAIEHPAVRKTALSLSSLGVDVQLIPVDSNGQINQEKMIELLTPSTILVSIQQVNNIVGSVLPVEDLARLTKQKVPNAVFHTDAVQAFGKVNVPKSPSDVDLVSISGHKVEGPKGVGALIVLNKNLMKTGIRPLIWGGDQEGGFRSGTQNAGLIAGFHVAARQTLEKKNEAIHHASLLRKRLEELLEARELLSTVRWNSPRDPAPAVPHIVSLSVPGFPAGPLAKLLEERNCLVSTGSACSSQKMEPDPVLAAMGLPTSVQGSAIRISFSRRNRLEEVDTLVNALDESIQLMSQLLGAKPRMKS